MTLAEQYKNQLRWRNQAANIQKLPTESHLVILDLGCGIGGVSKLLAQKSQKVIGIDNNPELLQIAKNEFSANNITYYLADLKNLHELHLPRADGIWSSFVASYFPDFKPVLASWVKLIKPGGWIAIQEMSGLFDHDPLSTGTKEIIKTYSNLQRNKNQYDFEMGSKLKSLLQKVGFEIIHEEILPDFELSFNGPATDDIKLAWENRFERMQMFQKYLGTKRFQSVKAEFINCLMDEKHTSNTRMYFYIATWRLEPQEGPSQESN